MIKLKTSCGKFFGTHRQDVFSKFGIASREEIKTSKESEEKLEYAEERHYENNIFIV